MSISRGLRYNLRKFNLQVGKQVRNDGNCWFHSMVYHGYGRSVKNLRIGLANMMFTLGNHKGIFPNQPDVSLRDIFAITDEVGNVFDCEDSKVHAYTYDTMCRDMRTNGSWTRLPMNLIMQFVSLLFDVEFRIIPDTAKEEPLRVVWDESRKYMNHMDLAKLGELHYVPLEKYVESDLEDEISLPPANPRLKIFSNEDEADQYYEESLEEARLDEEEKLNPPYMPHGYIAPELLQNDYEYNDDSYQVVSIDENGFEYVDEVGSNVRVLPDKND
jgi:hypothetical protein